MGLLTPPSMVPRALVEGPARRAAWSVTWSGWHSPIGSSRDQPLPAAVTGMWGDGPLYSGAVNGTGESESRGPSAS